MFSYEIIKLHATFNADFLINIIDVLLNSWQGNE